jgi:hypothetical protein
MLYTFILNSKFMMERKWFNSELRTEVQNTQDKFRS